MTNFDTIKAVTDNIETVMKALGIRFERRTGDDLKDIPASSLPLGWIFYEGETKENTYNERPSYIDAEFLVKVVISEREPRDTIRAQQKWAHLVSGALTVNALNTGALAASKFVSRVTIKAMETDNSRPDGTAAINCRAVVRYRES